MKGLILLPLDIIEMNEIRGKLREQYYKEKKQTSLDNIEDYADWLELRIMREPKEQLLAAMEEALTKAALEMDVARMAVKRVFNE